MLQVTEETGSRFEVALAAAAVAIQERGYYRKWLRYYLDFCAKYGRSPAKEASLGPFLEKLVSKNQSEAQRRQAAQAVRLYLGMSRTTSQGAGGEDARGKQAPPPQVRPAGLPARPTPGAITRGAQPSPGSPETRERLEPRGVGERPPPGPRPPANDGPAASPPDYPPQGVGAPDPSPVNGASWVKELDALRNAIRLRNYSPRTSETYVHWTRKFQTYTRGKPPNQLVTEDVKRFLTVHDGKGQKDRTVPLPKTLLPRIRDQFERVAAQRREDLAKNFAGAFLPGQLHKKYPNAGREFIWQWFFPSPRLTLVEAI